MRNRYKSTYVHYTLLTIVLLLMVGILCYRVIERKLGQQVNASRYGENVSTIVRPDRLRHDHVRGKPSSTNHETPSWTRSPMVTIDSLEEAAVLEGIIPEEERIVSSALEAVLEYQQTDKHILAVLQMGGDLRDSIRSRYMTKEEFDSDYALTDIMALLRRHNNEIKESVFAEEELYRYAEAVVEEILQQHPGHPGALLVTAQLVTAKGNPTQGCALVERLLDQLGDDRPAWLYEVCQATSEITNHPACPAEVKNGIQQKILNTLSTSEQDRIQNLWQAQSTAINQWYSRIQTNSQIFNKSTKVFLEHELYPEEIIESEKPKLYTEDEEFLRLWKLTYKIQALNMEGNERGLALLASRLTMEPGDECNADLASLATGMALARCGRLSTAIPKLEKALASPKISAIPVGLVQDCRLELATAYYLIGDQSAASRILSDASIIPDAAASYFVEGTEAIEAMLATLQQPI